MEQARINQMEAMKAFIKYITENTTATPLAGILGRGLSYFTTTDLDGPVCSILLISSDVPIFLRRAQLLLYTQV